MSHLTQPAAFPSIEDAEQARALALAVRHVNASMRTPISEVELRTALLTGDTEARFDNHLFAFIDETDRATLCDLVLSGATTYAQLATLADQRLPPTHPNRTWLDARRDL